MKKRFLICLLLVIIIFVSFVLIRENVKVYENVKNVNYKYYNIKK